MLLGGKNTLLDITQCRSSDNNSVVIKLNFRHLIKIS